MMHLLERDVEKAIIAAFWFRFRIHLFKTDAGAAGMRQGKPEGSGGGGYTGMPAGFSDLLGAIPPHGRAIFLEVKRPGRKPTAAQRAFLEARRAEGAVAFWADSVDSALRQFREQVAA